MPLPAALQNSIVQEAIKQAVPRLVTDVRFRSTFTDEAVVVTGQEILALLTGVELPPTETGIAAKKALEFAKPTIVLNSPAFGKRVWAPYGVADPKAPAIWRDKMKFWVIGGLGLIFVTGFTLGRVTKKGINDDKPRVRGAFGREQS